MNCVNCGSRISLNGCLCTPAALTEATSKLKCPFCGEEDFDATGLKVHLTWCDEFEKVPLPQMPNYVQGERS